METDNQVFELMIHTMELGVVIGIAVVIWIIRSSKKK